MLIHRAQCSRSRIVASSDALCASTVFCRHVASLHRHRQSLYAAELPSGVEEFADHGAVINSRRAHIGLKIARDPGAVVVLVAGNLIDDPFHLLLL